MKFSEMNNFHDEIHGQNPKDRRFKLNPRKRDLYRAYANSDARGFACADFDDELFIATMTLALRQAQFKGEQSTSPVILAVPKALDAWAYELSKTFYKLVLQNFRGDVSVAKAVRAGFDSIYWEHRSHLLNEEPGRWVAYGFDYSNPVPKWMEGRLIVPKRK